MNEFKPCCRRSRSAYVSPISKLTETAACWWGHRDATAILLAYRHGLRASELVADIDFRTSKLHVRRAEGGTASVHPLRAKELR